MGEPVVRGDGEASGAPGPSDAAGAREVARKALGNVPEDSPARLTKAFAYVLDEAVRIPGTDVRFGIDPILSLVPFAGTAVGATFGSVVLMDAVRLRAPVPVLARMLFNYAIDWALGLIPFVGAFFDMAYRSNKKNLKLLNRTIADREQVRRATGWYWVSVLVGVVAMLTIIIGTPIVALLWADSVISGR